MKSNQSPPKVLQSQYIPTAEFYSQVIDSLQDYSIFTLDNNLIINSWSTGSKLIFGYEPDEIIGGHFDTIFTEKDKKDGIPNVEIAKSEKDGRALDNRWHLCKDGSLIFAYGLVFPLTGIDGEKLGYVKILRDLTERRKSEQAIKKYVEELEELNTHKENLVTIISHDLRSPLTGIIAITDYLKSNFDNMNVEQVRTILDL